MLLESTQVLKPAPHTFTATIRIYEIFMQHTILIEP
jgi:hypothetical protein